LLILIALNLLLGLGATPAQSGGPVAVLTGHIAGRVDFYVLPDLKQGETLYVYMSGTSGNLDPGVYLTDASVDISLLRETYFAQDHRAMREGRDPVAAVAKVINDFFLAWDDDSGAGYDAALEFTIPADGDYQLVAGSTLMRSTFGDYVLQVGINAPQVLTGEARPRGDLGIFLDQAVARVDVAVQEITGTLTADNPSTSFILNDVKANDTLYVFVEATSGDLTPVIFLDDFGDKPLLNDNFSGEQTRATLQYTFDDNASNDRIRIASSGGGAIATTGDYRLLVGLNAPDVLTGQAATTGEPVIRQPIEVQVGIKIDQIPDIDQKAKNFTAVVNLHMRWTDPQLAFSPDTCQCDLKIFTIDEFAAFLIENGLRWPASTVFNQQGELFPQNQIVLVLPHGETVYFERATVTLQAPDFDFRKYPLDTQQFFIHIDSLFPEEFYVYTNLEDHSGLGDQLGLGEWIITEFDTSVSSQEFGSRFSFHFEAQRKITYYILRIFVPILIIIIVSWVTFFLKDYGKRVEIAAGNLLIFITYNFTIADELPHLGYLTLMDMILASTFVVTGLVIVYNVYLKRLEIGGKGDLAERIDRYMDWVYPLAYTVGIALTFWLFG